MGMAQQFAWKSAVMRMTWVVVAAASVSLLLDAVWPPAANAAAAGAWVGAFWTVSETPGPVMRFRVRLVRLAGLVAAAGVVWGVVDLAWPLEPQPTWLLHLGSVCVAWISCLAVIGVIELRVRRQRANTIASSGLL
ncbi:hypothetical protein ACQEVZ_37425 [Dactylosporangium sp. CA-152071]|uniref:hypothetical protein n=1 Tax=Dactylosporangium sp. CA-152071 TaxID=3239933 RepID=UPI003D8AB8AE